MKDTDYSIIDVELELTGTTEKDPKKSFGKLLAELGFEDAGAAPAPAAAGTTPPPAAPAALKDTDAGCTANPPNKDCPKCKTNPPAAGCPAATPAGASNDAPVPLNKLAKAPYALVIRNQQGYRVSGNSIPEELCYQAKQFKLRAEQAKK